MARLSFLENLDGVPTDILEPLLKRRGGKLLKVDRLLLHSPPFAVGWMGLVRAVIGEFNLTPRMSQLIMTAIAVLNDCEYELVAHGTSFLAAGGSKDQLAAMRQSVSGASRNNDLFDFPERAILALTIEMTCNVSVSDATFDAARKASGSDRSMNEIVGTIAAYNMVTRYVVALNLTTDQAGL